MISVRTKLYFSMENLILQQFFVFTFSDEKVKDKLQNIKKNF